MKLKLACICSLFSEMQTHPPSQRGQGSPLRESMMQMCRRRWKQQLMQASPDFLHRGFQVILACLLKRKEISSKAKEKMLPHWERNNHHFDTRHSYVIFRKFCSLDYNRKGRKEIPGINEHVTSENYWILPSGWLQKMIGFCLQGREESKNHKIYRDCSKTRNGGIPSTSICWCNRCKYANHIFMRLSQNRGHVF